MTRIIYVNGRYLPYSEAAIHPEDRGNQFADAVYEVCEVQDGRLIDEARHILAAEQPAEQLLQLGTDARQAGDDGDFAQRVLARQPVG